MIHAMTRLCNNAKRNGLIMSVVLRLVEAGRKVIALSDSRAAGERICADLALLKQNARHHLIE